MPIPRRVIVNGVKYKIKRLDANTHYGECCGTEKYIALNLEERRDELPDTLLHEILHAVINEYKPFVRKEEQLVVALEKGLMQVFRDNPKVAEYILCGANMSEH